MRSRSTNCRTGSRRFWQAKSLAERLWCRVRRLRKVGTTHQNMATKKLVGTATLPFRKLAAVFVEAHRGGGRYVVAVRQAPDRNLYDCVKQLQGIVGKSRAFVS